MQAKTACKKVIYWADDDIDDLELFREVLNEVAPEYELHQFFHGKLLLEHLEKLNGAGFPSLIILDMNMPVMDGRETLTQLQKEERYKTIPKVVFTTSDSEMDKMFCDWMHTEMLTKPYTYESLEQVLLKMLSYCKE
ncbi:CheY chemotaxis protein or a CheY-like REC (receiver) domain [Cnuella takakiae]|uniref:CheY chemotaxis protein or a CheY-like REC (Receiver) domain n=1 Tax=Cnuella takakiae TaxID=1302690 RepID=A0A1M4Z8Y0_9BACT|nr:response regulator [Cnuella takakiae]OLY94301.1 hypothetical protein BUE76_22240 [Cnuella takakiae]SHF14036.1 CheY chemotaxis protein or a CheY-like REC (receiver) domain [Cnuella takakiae]